MELELGIVVVGFAGIFLWTYFHRELPPKQPRPIPGKQQMIKLTVEPQLGVFQHEQGQGDDELPSVLPVQEQRL
jgi:hypothetical protein